MSATSEERGMSIRERLSDEERLAAVVRAGRRALEERKLTELGPLSQIDPRWLREKVKHERTGAKQDALDWALASGWQEGVEELLRLGASATEPMADPGGWGVEKSKLAWAIASKQERSERALIEAGARSMEPKEALWAAAFRANREGLQAGLETLRKLEGLGIGWWGEGEALNRSLVEHLFAGGVELDEAQQEEWARAIYQSAPSQEARVAEAAWHWGMAQSAQGKGVARAVIEAMRDAPLRPSKKEGDQAESDEQRASSMMSMAAEGGGGGLAMAALDRMEAGLGRKARSLREALSESLRKGTEKISVGVISQAQEDRVRARGAEAIRAWVERCAPILESDPEAEHALERLAVAALVSLSAPALEELLVRRTAGPRLRVERLLDQAQEQMRRAHGRWPEGEIGSRKRELWTGCVEALVAARLMSDEKDGETTLERSALSVWEKAGKMMRVSASWELTKAAAEAKALRAISPGAAEESKKGFRL